MNDTDTTAALCQTCGKPIPPLPVEHAFCVACRYSKQGERISTAAGADEIALENTTAPAPTESAELALITALEETGATFPDLPAALLACHPVLDAAGDWRAAETLSMIFARLPGGRRGSELRAALLGTSVDGSCTEMARKFNISPVTWFKSIQRLRNRIFSKTANARPSCRRH